MVRESDKSIPAGTTRVNIVYVNGTVDLLLPVLDSVIEQTNWRLRLVANGCTPEERALLASVEQRVGDRVEVYVASVERVLAHGVVLDRLVDMEESPYFCFVDSDVLAIRPTDFSALLPTDERVSFCSCLPIWQPRDDATLPDSFQIADGEYVATVDGQHLGCSYAATYHVSDLRRVMADWSLSFVESHWDKLSPEVRRALERNGQRRLVYDTGKVINLMLAFESNPVVYRPTPTLLHVGAMSTQRLKPVSRFGHLLKMRAPALYRVWASIARGLGRAEALRIARAHRRKQEASGFCQALFDGSASADTAPAWLAEQPETLNDLVKFAETTQSGRRPA